MKSITIGRSQTNMCVIENPTVSRNHAVLNVDSDGVHATLKDLNSTHGTFVNGSNQRITTEVRVSVSDTVRFGTETMTVSSIVSKSKPNDTVIQPASTPGVDRRTIGKSSDNQIVISHDDVSRKHALIYKNADGSVVIEDLNSTNGTFVNGTRITSKKLVKGDRVTITRNYNLDWENIFSGYNPKPMQPTTKWVKPLAIAACAAVVIGLICVALWVWPGPLNKWSKEKIYKEYHSAVCWVYVQYGYQILLDGEDCTSTFCSLFDLPSSDYIHIEDDAFAPGLLGAQGTAFFVSNDGKMVTNLHISRPWLFSEDSKTIEQEVNKIIAIISIQNPFLSRSKVEVRGVVQKMFIIPDGLPFCESNAIECREYCGHDDINKDVAIIQLTTNKLPSEVTRIVNLSEADLSDEAIAEGKEVFTIGFPYGVAVALDNNQVLKNQVHSGSVNQDRGDYEFGHDAATAGGASGSPIFNDKGKLIGIHHAGLTGVTGAQGFNRGIKVRYILELLNR